MDAQWRDCGHGGAGAVDGGCAGAATCRPAVRGAGVGRWRRTRRCACGCVEGAGARTHPCLRHCRHQHGRDRGRPVCLGLRRGRTGTAGGDAGLGRCDERFHGARHAADGAQGRGLSASAEFRNWLPRWSAEHSCGVCARAEVDVAIAPAHVIHVANRRLWPAADPVSRRGYQYSHRPKTGVCRR